MDDLEYADKTYEPVDAQASIFANEEDLRRYRAAKAAGLSDHDAFKVGDNGIGAWGADTTSTTIPQIALPPDTPGFQKNRKVLVTGPKGSVVAQITDQLPPYSKLQGHGTIDVNPATALAIGHPGGVTPVKWTWADEPNKQNLSDADVAVAGGSDLSNVPAPTGNPYLKQLNAPAGPDAFSQKLAQDLATGPRSVAGETEIGVSGAEGGAGEELDESPSAPDEPETGGIASASIEMQPSETYMAPPPPSKDVKFVKYDQQGGKVLSNGVTVYPDNSTKFQIGDRTFYKSGQYGTVKDITPKGSTGTTPQQVFDKKSAEKGILRTDFPEGKDGDAQYKAAAAAAISGADTGREIADAIAAGNQPPVLTGMYRYGPAVRKALAEKGYNLTAANLDWQATTKHMAAMNSSQQLKITQNLDNLDHALNLVDELSDKWKAGKFPLLNKARLAAAMQGALGPEAQSVATQLNGQINDMIANLGAVYMGTGTPTDKSLALAQNNLSADWSDKVLHDMTDLTRRNLAIRKNAIMTSPAIKMGDQAAAAGTPAGPPAPNTSASPSPATPPKGTIRVIRKSDGQPGTIPAERFDPNKYTQLP